MVRINVLSSRIRNTVYSPKENPRANSPVCRYSGIIITKYRMEISQDEKLCRVCSSLRENSLFEKCYSDATAAFITNYRMEM